MSISQPRPPSTWSGPLRPHYKVALLLEIVRTYVAARREMRGNQIVVATQRLRESGPRHPPVFLPDRRDAALHLASAANRVLRRLPTDSRCLVRALVLSALLARRDVPSILVVAARPDPSFAAHAWVEVDGRALLPPGDPSMQRLVEI